jgi:uncharacterized damage-inducible protein DinB
VDFLAQARRQMLAGQLSDTREQLLESFAGLSDEEMLEPGVTGSWSTKDVLTHVAAWDRVTSEAFRAMLEGERHPMLEWDVDGVQQFNEQTYEANKSRDLNDVLTELNASREELTEFLRDLDSVKMFAPAPGDEHADMSIAAMVSVQVDHDQEHAEMIEEWRQARDTNA